MSADAPRDTVGLSQDEIEPNYDSPPPKTLTKTRHIDSVQWLAGRGLIPGATNYDIMLVTSTVDEEEASSMRKLVQGMSIRVVPEYLKGATSVIKAPASAGGVDIDKCYYTALVKWLLPRTKRQKPSKRMMSYGMPVLMDEIARVKPKIIVCLGKPVFDMLSSEKISFSDGHGGWFWSDKVGCYLYMMSGPSALIGKPDMFETFRVDFAEVARKYREITLGPDTTDQVQWCAIRTEEDLIRWVVERRIERRKLFSVDCEWHGRQYVDGQLRTLAAAWTDVDAAVIVFRDEQNKFCFKFSQETQRQFADDLMPEEYERAAYAKIGEILNMLFADPDVRFIGHHISADAPWMMYWLGIEIWGRCIMDTEFAQQVVDEASELGLERGISMKYTTLGYYKQALVEWKRNNRKLCEDGYGFIPEEILLPYNCLAWNTEVLREDGEWETISSLVERKYDGRVISLADGRPKPCKVTGWHHAKNPGQKWYRIRTTASNRSAFDKHRAVFTPDHEVLTQRGKVRVDELVPRYDQIVTPEADIDDMRQVVILANLISGAWQLREAGRDVSKHARRDFEDWKALPTLFQPADQFSDEHARPWCDSIHASRDYVDKILKFEALNGRRGYQTAPSRALHYLLQGKTFAGGRLKLTREIIDMMGGAGYAALTIILGELYVKSPDEKELRFRCGHMSVTEAKLLKEWIVETWPLLSGDARVVATGPPYDLWLTLPPHAYGFVNLFREAVISAMGTMSCQDLREPFCDLITSVEEVRVTKHHREDRYCITVPEAGNFLTRIGFVSNCNDVIAPFRAYPKIRRQLEGQQLTGYYDNMFNPFVTDIFTSFTYRGLPMDRRQMDDLRKVFHFARRRMEVELKRNIHSAAKLALLNKLADSIGVTRSFRCLADVIVNAKDDDDALRIIQSAVAESSTPETWMQDALTYRAMIVHLRESVDFNIRSPDAMRRWLYQVHGLTPAKSTNQKAKGLPSMAWDKVMELPEGRRALYTPAVDKQTLQILSTQFPLLKELLDLNAVGNVCKAFLKEAEVLETDFEVEDTEEDDAVASDKRPELVKEQGLHAWLSSKDRVHGLFSATETGRPRSFQPNSLNWPSYVNEKIGKSIVKAVHAAHECSELPDDLLHWVGKMEKQVPSIRSCVSAPDGWVMVESDYCTAEMVALAYRSGDKDLLRILREPDPEWAKLTPEAAERTGAKFVRVRYETVDKSGIPVANQKPEYLFAVWKEGVHKCNVTEADIARNPDGSFAHRGYDIHWSIAERIYERPREELVEKIHRNAGKVINFSCLSCRTAVTTSEGKKLITQLSSGHLLWDGVDWCRHAGITYSGNREVITYAGITATPEHVVWDEHGNAVCLIDASWQRARLADSSHSGRSLPLRLRSGDVRVDAEGRSIDRRVQEVRSASQALCAQNHGRADDALRVRLRREIQRHARDDARQALSVHAPALLPGQPRVEPQLQGSRDRSSVHPGGVHSVGARDVAGGDIPEQGLRSDRQQRSLREVEPPSGRQVEELEEHAQVGSVKSSSGGGVPGYASGLQADAEAHPQSDSDGQDVGGDCRAGIQAGGLLSREGCGESSAASGVVRWLLEGECFVVGSDVGGSGEGSMDQACDREPDTPVEWIHEWFRLTGVRPPGPAVHAGTPGVPLLQGYAAGDIQQPTAELGHGPALLQGEGKLADSHGGEVRGAVSGHLQSGDCGNAFSQAGHVGHASCKSPYQIRIEPVYDILNVGPYHRFALADGTMVSNSAYGATASSLERKIEADTGVKPDEGVGEKGLDAIRARQPKASQFLDDMEKVPLSPGYARAASGRVRHCVLHSRGAEVGWRTRNSQESALGREMRNFYMQESVGATSMRACIWAMNIYRRLGMQAYVMTCLYDSLVSLCPLEERFVVDRIHTAVMSLLNTWDYEHDGEVMTLQYDIETDFNYRWSTKPSAAQLQDLKSQEFHATPERLRWTLTAGVEMWRVLAS